MSRLSMMNARPSVEQFLRSGVDPVMKCLVRIEDNILRYCVRRRGAAEVRSLQSAVPDTNPRKVLQFPLAESMKQKPASKERIAAEN